jgi:signal transduction histidine kinase
MKSASASVRSPRENFEPYGISRLSLKFKSGDGERAYRNFVLDNSLAYIRFSLLVAIILITAYALLDPFVYEGSGSLLPLYLIRALIIVATLAVALATFHSRYPEISQLLGSIVIVAIGSGWLAFAYKTDLNGIVDNFSSIIMTSAYGFFFCGLLFRYGFWAGGAINVLYSFAIWSVDMPPVMGASINISMFVIFLLLAMAPYQKELNSRKLFVTENRERDALIQRSQRDERDLVWLRALANFLRHEVRQPVAQINSSIELAQLMTREMPQLAPYLNNAATGAQHVWNLVERASRATDAEAFVRQRQVTQLDLCLLISEVVDGYQQTFSGVTFTLQRASSITLHADPTLIAEAVGNLLGNAASFACEESAIEIAVGRTSTHAVITVTNKGPLLEGEPERLFESFATTRSDLSGGVHQGLGLYLVQLIAEQHGGEATISNLEDGSGVKAAILLPLPV